MGSSFPSFLLCVLVVRLLLFGATSDERVWEEDQSETLLSEEEESNDGCAAAPNCVKCVQNKTCVWCLHTALCVSKGQCSTTPYTECCVTFTSCGDCVANTACGWCARTGCKKGSRSGPDADQGNCTTQWNWKNCPGGSSSEPFSDLAIFLGVAIALGGAFAIFVLILLALLIRRILRQQAAVNELARQEKIYRQHRPSSDSEDESPKKSVIDTNGDRKRDPTGYSSLAPLIRQRYIEQGQTDYQTLKRIEQATEEPQLW